MIADQGFDSAYGVITSMEEIWRLITFEEAQTAYKEVSSHVERGRIVSLDEAEAAKYRYKFIFANMPGETDEGVPQGSVVVVD